MIKFHQKNLIEFIPYNEINPEKTRQNNQRFKNNNNIENKLTRFQIYPKTELVCKYNNPICKTQNSEILVEYERGFDMNTDRKTKTYTKYNTSHFKKR